LYSGATIEGLSLGYECEQHDNPADFFLDVVFQNEVEKFEGGTNGTYASDKLPCYH